MKDYDGFTIEIVNFERFNPRQDAKKPSWFRMENTMATGMGFHSLDCEQKWLWVVVLSLISQANGQPIVWDSDYIRSLTKITTKKQFQTIEIFEKFGNLRVSRNVTLRDSHATDGRTDGRTDSAHDLKIAENSENQKTVNQEEQGEEWLKKIQVLYASFPKRKGSTNQKKGIAILTGLLLKEKKEDREQKFERMFAATQRYAKQQRDMGKEGTEYIMQFATFANGRWEEYVPTEEEIAREAWLREMTTFEDGTEAMRAGNA